MNEAILLASVVVVTVIVLGIVIARFFRGRPPKRETNQLANAVTTLGADARARSQPSPIPEATRQVTLRAPDRSAVIKKLWVGTTSDRTVWRCNTCVTINEWSATICGHCGKSYAGEEKMWECSYCFTINAWSARKCGHCDKEYRS